MVSKTDRKMERTRRHKRVRTKRPPEVYRGKGIKYAEEVIRRKVGKTGK